MKDLIFTLLATSSVDSLNPIGITQQFILQGMVKKPRHIWYFILTTGVVNMIFGYLVYYGVMTIINNGLDFIMGKYGLIIYSLELALGLLALFFGIKGLIKRIIKTVSSKRNEAAYQADQIAEEEKIKSKIKLVTPLALIGTGVVSTASELTSAVPYFAFLAVLITYKLPFWLLTLVLIFYNIIYMAPFIILYFVYIISKKRFDSIYDFFKKYLKKISGFLVPILLLAIAFVIIFDSTANIINFI